MLAVGILILYIATINYPWGRNEDKNAFFKKIPASDYTTTSDCVWQRTA